MICAVHWTVAFETWCSGFSSRPRVGNLLYNNAYVGWLHLANLGVIRSIIWECCLWLSGQWEQLETAVWKAPTPFHQTVRGIGWTTWKPLPWGVRAKYYPAKPAHESDTDWCFEGIAPILNSESVPVNGEKALTLWSFWAPINLIRSLAFTFCAHDSCFIPGHLALDVKIGGGVGWQPSEADEEAVLMDKLAKGNAVCRAMTMAHPSSPA